jgi:tRNA pseudouridine38-40 synthase
MTSGNESSKEPSRQRVLLLLAYDGTNYSGFAPQSNAPTVANSVIAALRDIDPEIDDFVGASRTDAGVHALAQPVSFTSCKAIVARGWVLALTQRLPKDITVAHASFVPLDFDPRRDALWKRYHYRVLTSQVEDPFLGRIAWRIGNRLDIESMKTEAHSLQGEHDLRAFRSIDDQRSETIRRMDRVEVCRCPHDPRLLDIYVQGNRFMYNMVRIIAGTLVDVGRGRVQPGAFARAIESGDRRDLGMTAPPHGLTLAYVKLRTPHSEGWPVGEPEPGAPLDASRLDQ